MDINVKGVEPAIAKRLAEQAAAEGMSQQEWLREVLRRTAGRLCPAELVAQRATITPMGADEFDRLRETVAARRAHTVERLNATDGRR